MSNSRLGKGSSLVQNAKVFPADAKLRWFVLFANGVKIAIPADIPKKHFVFLRLKTV